MATLNAAHHDASLRGHPLFAPQVCAFAPSVDARMGASRLPHMPPCIQFEQRWRQPPTAGVGCDARIMVGRWRQRSAEPTRHVSPDTPDHATIEIAMLPMNFSLRTGGRLVHDGRTAAGAVAASAPGVEVEAEFRGPCDVLHLFVPTGLLAEVSHEAGAGAGLGRLANLTRPFHDAAIERLAVLLLKAAEFDCGAGDLYLEGINLAIVARLLRAGQPSELAAGRSEGLVKWRLKRVLDFIDAGLGEPITLADLAKCAGLSRMHFAAQFRTATGMRPHEYLIRKRVQRAQELLASTQMPLAEVALTVGFQTQAHFTTVFRRLLAETPGRWRQLQQVSFEARAS